MSTTEKLLALESLAANVNVDETALDEESKDALVAGLQEVHHLVVEALRSIGVSYATNLGRGE